VRRDDQVALLAPGELARIVGQHSERVGIEDERHSGLVEQCAHELCDLRRATEARAACNDVVLLLEQPIDAARVESSRGVVW
jgi:hypothetical protein